MKPSQNGKAFKLMKHFNVSIFGRVQGVGFRWSALKLAEKLNLKGFVENAKDGSLYIEVEGDEENLEKFMNWCRKGPWLAEVSSIQVEEAEAKSYNTFEIKH